MKNTYMVSASGACMSRTLCGIRQKLYESANGHCAGMNQDDGAGLDKERPYELGHNTGSIESTLQCE
jgi:hypothetical protein